MIPVVGQVLSTPTSNLLSVDPAGLNSTLKTPASGYLTTSIIAGIAIISFLIISSNCFPLSPVPSHHIMHNYCIIYNYPT